jgi:alpha-galactosidase
VAVEVQRSDARLRVQTDALTLEVERATLSIALASRAHRVRVSGLRPCARIGGERRFAREARLDGFGEIRTRHGSATRLELSATDGDLELRLGIDVADEWSGIAVDLALETRGAPVEVDALDLFWSDEDGTLELPGPPSEWRFFRLGYQSWSPAGWVGLGERERRPRLGMVRTVNCGPGTPDPAPGRHVSDFATVLRSPERGGLTLGFVTHERYLTHVECAGGASGVSALAACTRAERAHLRPGEAARAERLWLGLDGPKDDGIARWAERAGIEMEAPVPQRAPAGWCSWYHFFTRVRARDVSEQLGRLAALRGQLEVVQIDDGYQAAVGDWLEWGPRFPDGLAPLARQIRDAGFRAGIWLAPFLASRASRLAREHPDWLLRDETGKRVTALLNPAWKGRRCYALDSTLPQARAHLAGVVARLRELGFDYFKLDFLYAGALPGARREPTPSAAAYRLGLRTIREAAGSDGFLVGCGAPLGPSIGLVDAMRIGPDTAPAWRARLADLVYGIPCAPSARNALRNVLARAALHQRLWLNDPDCALVRERSTRLSATEVETLAAAIAASGGLVVDSDDLGCVGPERLALLRRLLPASGRSPQLADPAGEIPEELWVPFPDGSALALRVNLGERAASVRLDPRRYGLEPPLRAYDVLADRDLGAVAGPLERELPPHAAWLVRLAPWSSRPALVGSSLHLAGGALEVARLRAEGDGSTRLRLRLPGPRTGRVIVAPAQGAELSIGVAFDDDLELALPPPNP